jgi:hypothetical protein
MRTKSEEITYIVDTVHYVGSFVELVAIIYIVTVFGMGVVRLSADFRASWPRNFVVFLIPSHQISG